jgi:tRNA-specific 2-thiouridylase
MKAAVGLSGGIDSGTTALMLQEQGYEVIGVTMWLFDHQTEEIETAALISKLLGIEHHVLDYRKNFDDLVISSFIDAYDQGHTPNPCIVCNKTLKYGRLIDDSIALGADVFATGHYARHAIHPKTGEHQLKKAVNHRKDQSYNLYHLNQDTLSKLIFPLGEARSKEDVRDRFLKIHSGIARKKDSLGICFIKRAGHGLFLKEMACLSMQPGNFVDQNGKILGRHFGTANFTIGQKRKLGHGLTGNYVVVALNPSTNEVVLGQESDLLHTSLVIEDFHLIEPSVAEALTRSIQMVDVLLSQWSAVYSAKLGLNQNIATLEFDTPVRAPAKGQALVCYQGDVLLGGGII